MRNIFIINPFAGQGKGTKEFANAIENVAQKRNDKIEIYFTKGVADATNFVKNTLAEASETVRFFSCGGDGTLNEVINGAVGAQNAIIGCVPIGTGNDFVRNFDDDCDFSDIASQLDGIPTLIDLVHYEATCEGKKRSGYAINMFNIGFDCNVVDLTSRLKTYPLIKGSFAYLLGVAIILLKKKGAFLKINSNKDLYHEGRLLLTTIANGCFCGGGVRSNPHASLNDGLFDVQIVKNISRLAFITLFPKYKKGTHLAGHESFISYKKTDTLFISTQAPNARVSIDGEVMDFEAISLKIAPKSLTFSVPTKRQQ